MLYRACEVCGEKFNLLTLDSSVRINIALYGSVQNVGQNTRYQK